MVINHHHLGLLLLHSPFITKDINEPKLYDRLSYHHPWPAGEIHKDFNDVEMLSHQILNDVLMVLKNYVFYIPFC